MLLAAGDWGRSFYRRSLLRVWPEQCEAVTKNMLSRCCSRSLAVRRSPEN